MAVTKRRKLEVRTLIVNYCCSGISHSNGFFTYKISQTANAECLEKQTSTNRIQKASLKKLMDADMIVDKNAPWFVGQEHKPDAIMAD